MTGLQRPVQFGKRVACGGVKFVGFPVRDLADAELAGVDADCRKQHHLTVDVGCKRWRIRFLWPLAMAHRREP